MLMWAHYAIRAIIQRHASRLAQEGSEHLSMTYDQGREKVKHAEITQKAGTAIYFSDPRSP
ncbi:hypothetical protein SAMN05192555_103210 [Franzmannia pantelleriensis]|uniref:Uncharacterized protein n=1 Tax=Franzmannia pantelleriensis TaxID=48727 RepID=A0A1G9ILD1_9GAMM|nr:hypothetical protein SAMN05192555_103210 [Halomonas pantelleriensis]